MYAGRYAERASERLAMTATLMRVAGVLYQWARPAAASVLANAEAAAKAMHSSFHLRGWKREGAYHAAGAFAHTVVWACAHVDDDVLHGMIIARERNRKAGVAGVEGEHFYFPSLRVLVRFHDGGVLFFHPRFRHCVTEGWYTSAPPSPAPCRTLLSLFLKKETAAGWMDGHVCHCESCELSRA